MVEILGLIHQASDVMELAHRLGESEKGKRQIHDQEQQFRHPQRRGRFADAAEGVPSDAQLITLATQAQYPDK